MVRMPTGSLQGVRGSSDETVGFAPGVGDAELEMWIRKSDLLPLRIEARVEDPKTMFTSVYSDFGTDVDVSVPENVIHVGLMDGLMEGALSPEQLGEVVRALPVAGQPVHRGGDRYGCVPGSDRWGQRGGLPGADGIQQLRRRDFPLN